MRGHNSRVRTRKDNIRLEKRTVEKLTEKGGKYQENIHEFDLKKIRLNEKGRNKDGRIMGTVGLGEREKLR